MTDAEYEAQKARVLALIEKWVKPIGLGWWRIEFRWSRTIKEGDDDSQARDCLMDCTASWKYHSACITTYLPNATEQTDTELEWAFVHELMHVLVNETRETDDDWLKHEERVCSDLASAFIWLRDSIEGEKPSAPDVPTEVPEMSANGAVHHLVEVV